MWFRKKKEVSNGITFEEWIQDHIEDKKYLRVYTGKEGTFRLLDTFGSVDNISYGIAEKYKNNTVSIIEVVDRNNEPDTTLVFIEK